MASHPPIETPLPEDTPIAKLVNGMATGQAITVLPDGSDPFKKLADAIVAGLVATTRFVRGKPLAAPFPIDLSGDVPDAIYVATGGDLVVEGRDGVPVTFAMDDKSQQFFAATSIEAGTDCGGMVALYTR